MLSPRLFLLFLLDLFFYIYFEQNEIQRTELITVLQFIGLTGQY